MHIPGEHIGGHIGCFFSDTDKVAETADTDTDESSEYSEPGPPEENEFPEFSSSDGKFKYIIFPNKIILY